MGATFTPREMIERLVAFDTTSRDFEPRADRFRRRLSEGATASSRS